MVPKTSPIDRMIQYFENNQLDIKNPQKYQMLIREAQKQKSERYDIRDFSQSQDMPMVVDQNINSAYQVSRGHAPSKVQIKDSSIIVDRVKLNPLFQNSIHRQNEDITPVDENMDTGTSRISYTEMPKSEFYGEINTLKTDERSDQHKNKAASKKIIEVD